MRVGVLTGGGDAPGLNCVIRAVVRRGKLIAEVLSGASGVVAVHAAAEDTTMGETAAYNGPQSTVVAGDEEALASVLAAFPRAKRIPMDYASHSSQVDTTPAMKARSVMRRGRSHG